MGKSSSKIPVSYPDQVLKRTGIAKCDEHLCVLNKDVKAIDDIRTELDLRFTDFIRSLNASYIWEKCPEFKEMIKIMLVVLATNGKGSITTFIDEPPYIEFGNNSSFNRMLFPVIKNFEAYIDAVDHLIVQLKELKQRFDDMDVTSIVDHNYDKIAGYVIEGEYSIHDMVQAVQIVDSNNKNIMKAMTSLEHMLQLPAQVKSDIKFILHEYQKVNILDKILQQILQVIGEGLSSPEAIVNHIWPYPYTQRA